MSRETERELLERAQTGDDRAFAELYIILHENIERFAYRLIGNSSDIPDIVQSSFVSLYCNLNRIERPESLRPYLFRIVRNLCYDTLRARGRFERVELRDDDPVDDDSNVNGIHEAPPDELSHWFILYEKVGKAIERLPELQRQAMVLWFHEGLKYREVAEAMNTDIGTVKSRIHSARRNLRKLLGPEFLKELGIQTVS